MALRRGLSERRGPLAVGLVALVGAILVVVGIVLYVMTSQFLATSIMTTGFVAQVAAQNAADVQAAEYRTAIRYRATNNQEYILRQAFRAQPKVGDPVPIIYSAANPQQAQVHDSADLWGPAWSFLLGGVLTIAVAVGIWTLLMRRRLFSP